MEIESYGSMVKIQLFLFLLSASVMCYVLLESQMAKEVAGSGMLICTILVAIATRLPSIASISETD